MAENERHMSLERFRQLLDVHGADRRRWPKDTLVPAQMLLRQSEQARRLLAEARALDDLLKESMAPPADEALLARIRAVATGDARPAAAPEARAAEKESLAAPPTASPVPARHVARVANVPWWMGLSIAASLLLGVWLGLSGVLSPLEETLLAETPDEMALIVELARMDATDTEEGRL